MMQNKKHRLEALGIQFKPININEMKLVMPDLNYTVVMDDKLVKSIEYDTETICVGERYNVDISTYNIEYKVNSISLSKAYPKVISISESKYNTSTLFALPLIFKSREQASFIVQNTGYLLNGFIDCDFIQSKDNYSVFVLLKFSKSELFKRQEELFLNHDCFVRKEDVTSRYVVYEFSIPLKFRDDYKLILEGGYSKLSKLGKNALLAFHGNTIEGSTIDKIINRSPDLIKHYEEVYDMSMSGIELYKKINEDDILTKDLL